MKYVFFLIAWLLSPFIWGAEESELPVNLRIKLQNLERAQAPFNYANFIIFSYQSEEQIYTAKIVFKDRAHRSHLMKKNIYNVYFYWREINEEKRVEYRFVVNGLWSIDPLNLNYTIDENGVKISYYETEEANIPRHNPLQQGHTQIFYYQGEPQRKIYLVGNFSAGSLFSTPLKEKEPGLYSISLRLAPGEYYYYFHEQGRFFTDPNNALQVKDRYGRHYSKFSVK